MHFRRPFSRVLGQSIDFWSVPHFLFGVLIAMIVQVFSFSAVPLFMVMLSIAILWEIVEMRLKIRESLINVFSDISLPLGAYVLTLWLTDSRAMRHDQLVALLNVTIVTYVLVSYLAWRARFEHDPDFLN
jgi:hypothetical protein